MKKVVICNELRICVWKGSFWKRFEYKSQKKNNEIDIFDNNPVYSNTIYVFEIVKTKCKIIGLLLELRHIHFIKSI